MPLTKLARKYHIEKAKGTPVSVLRGKTASGVKESPAAATPNRTPIPLSFETPVPGSGPPSQTATPPASVKSKRTTNGEVCEIRASDEENVEPPSRNFDSLASNVTVRKKNRRPPRQSLASLQSTVIHGGDYAVSDCKGWARLESTHIDHLVEEKAKKHQHEHSIWTEDLSDIAPQPGKQVVAPPESEEPVWVTAVEESPEEDLARQVLVSDSSSDSDVESDKTPSKPDRTLSRRSTLGRHEVILLTSDSSDLEESSSVYVIPQRPPSAEDLLSRSRLQKVNRWVVESPFQSSNESSPLRSGPPVKSSSELFNVWCNITEDKADEADYDGDASDEEDGCHEESGLPNPGEASEGSSRAQAEQHWNQELDSGSRSVALQVSIGDSTKDSFTESRSVGLQVSIISDSSSRDSISESKRRSVSLQVSLSSHGDVDQDRDAEKNSSCSFINGSNPDTANTLSDIVGPKAKRNIFGNLLYLSSSPDDTGTEKELESVGSAGRQRISESFDNKEPSSPELRVYHSPVSQPVQSPQWAVPESPPPPGPPCVNSPDQLSFLTSLSLEEPNFRCHPEAVKYVKNFKKHKDELLVRLFALFNDKAFDNVLPESMELVWNPRLTKTAGVCVQRKIRKAGAPDFGGDGFDEEERLSKIELSSKVVDSADRLRDTLIHEMCHAAAWIRSGVRDGHGKFWKAHAAKAMEAFPELPIIARCHAYAIRTKFMYVCTTCGHRLGRHSKSLNTAKRACPFCQGKFELEPATSDSNTSDKSTPMNKFAQFVKENYRSCRTPGTNHGDAMKLLSQKFAEAKLSTI